MNYEETLSTLKAIQASYSPTPFLMDPDTEPRFVIDSDERTIEIPDEFKFLAVKMDHMSERIYFEIPRYFDGEDLATKICVVQYINANKEEVIEGIASVTDVDYTSVNEKIIFRWDVDNNVTKYAGDVSFAVRFYTISDDNRFTYSWNTVPATLPILDTLDNTGSAVTENYPTELILWQYRMTELDRTISEKIEEATTSIDADTKAAQAARQGAEDAEARVNAIVAGNEAYTKQQSHDLFALALRGTAEAAKSITIYPDKGSNVVATIHGFTTQEGEGDPKPPAVVDGTVSGGNVRAIKTGGTKVNLFNIPDVESTYMDLNYKVKKGVFSFSGNVAASRLFKYASFPIELEPGEYTAIANQYIGGNWAYSFLDEAGERVYYVDRPGVTKRFTFTLPKRCVKVELRAYLGSSFAGKYVSCEYIPCLYKGANDGTPAAPNVGGEYVAVLGEANGEGVALALSAPLCEGDTVVTRIMSGCDKVIALSDLSWAKVGSGANTFSAPISGVTQNQAYSDAYPFLATVSTSQNCISVNDAGVFVTDKSCASVEDLQRKLSQSRARLWYRSTGYTKSKDKFVSVGIHKRTRWVLTGRETWYAMKEANQYNTSNRQIKDANNLTCTHYKPFRGAWSSIPDKACAATERLLAIHDSTFSSPEELKTFLSQLYDIGVPVELVYELDQPWVFAHDPVDFIASPDDDGAWVITGEADGTVSAEYNKNITKALEDILTRISALELHALGG